MALLKVHNQPDKQALKALHSTSGPQSRDALAGILRQEIANLHGKLEYAESEKEMRMLQGALSAVREVLAVVQAPPSW